MASRVRFPYLAVPVNLLLWSRMPWRPEASGDPRRPVIIPTLARVRTPRVDKSGRTSAGILADERIPASEEER